jgi:hypothetical protein
MYFDDLQRKGKKEKRRSRRLNLRIWGDIVKRLTLS